MSSLIPFSFESHSVRAFNIDGNPWFVGKDVCDVLGYANASDAINQHCKGVAKRYPLQTTGGIQEVRIINEPDTYRLITGSTLPEANRFESWLFEDVLPSIRKTGSYQIPDAAHDLPIIESSLVLDFQGVPIRFLIDRDGNWQAVYADIARALGYLTKEQQYNARNILKVEVKGENKQLRHPLYGDLIYAAGIPKFLGRFTRYQAGSFDKFLAAGTLQNWLDKTAKSLINQPVAAGRLLESTQARALEIAPIDWEFTQAVQVFECWFAVLGDAVLTTRQVIDRAAGTPLAALLLDIAEGRRSPGVVSSLRLGIWLARRVGWDFDGWVLPPVMCRKNDVKRWTLRRVISC